MSATRVGMYNRWLATLGGGEKHSLAIAAYLSREHPVEVISHQPVSRDLASERLSLDLSRVQFTTIPDRDPLGISLLTSDYDLFINTSYQDFFPSFAPHSATLIYFPAKLDRRKAWGRQMKLWLRRALKLPAVLVGIHAFQPNGGDFRWNTGPVVKIRLPAAAAPYTFAFNLRALDPGLTAAALHIDRSPAGSLALPPGGLSQPCTVRIPAGAGYRELTISAAPGAGLDETPGLEISGLWLSLPQYRLYHALLERWLTGVAVRLQYYPPGASLLDYLDTYSQIWANSEFTRRWIKSYWQRSSQVLYPPVDLSDFRPGRKTNRILNVGRFFAGQHNKKHAVLVEAFKNLVDGGLQGWELHLAGGRMKGDDHQAYLDGVYQAAAGYPVHIYPDIAFRDLAELYATSSIYWHASGYGEDDRQDPEKFEHFGITTVEAMASGCAPVVIGKGGQPEIVTHGRNGFLWQTLPELQSHTLRLVADPALREQISAAAVESSRQYDNFHFQDRLQTLLGQMGFP